MKRNFFLISISFAALAAGFAMPAAAEETTGPLILGPMADGMCYQPSATPPTIRCPERHTVTEPAVVTIGAATSTEVVEPVDSLLKKAILRGRAMLQARIDQAKKDGKKAKVVSSCPSSVFVTLAVWDEASDKIHQMVVKKQGAKAAIVSSEVSSTVTIRRNNGANSEFVLSNGMKVVALDYTICSQQASGKYALEDVVYTPYSRALHTPEMIAWGKATLEGMIERAYADLAARNVQSLAYKGQPLIEVIPRDFAKSIILIEHLSPASLLGETPERSVETMYVILAANQDDSYDYAVSSAGARGLVQFIPSTYKLMTRFTALGLTTDFAAAMTDPVNAIKAQVAYLDTELASMPLSVKDLYHVDNFRVREYLAAAYNGGGARVRLAVKTWGEGWSELQKVSSLRAETIAYVKKLRIARDLLNPPLTRVALLRP